MTYKLLNIFSADWTACNAGNVSIVESFDTVQSLCTSIQVDRGLVYTTVLGFQALALVDGDSAVMREAEHPDARSFDPIMVDASLYYPMAGAAPAEEKTAGGFKSLTLTLTLTLTLN